MGGGPGGDGQRREGRAHRSFAPGKGHQIGLGATATTHGAFNLQHQSSTSCVIAGSTLQAVTGL